MALEQLNVAKRQLNRAIGMARRGDCAEARRLFDRYSPNRGTWVNERVANHRDVATALTAATSLWKTFDRARKAIIAGCRRRR